MKNRTREEEEGEEEEKKKKVWKSRFLYAKLRFLYGL